MKIGAAAFPCRSAARIGRNPQTYDPKAEKLPHRSALCRVGSKEVAYVRSEWRSRCGFHSVGPAVFTRLCGFQTTIQRSHPVSKQLIEFSIVFPLAGRKMVESGTARWPTADESPPRSIGSHRFTATATIGYNCQLVGPSKRRSSLSRMIDNQRSVNS